MNEKIISIEAALAELKIPASPEGLYEPVRYILKLGGKRMRPLLVAMGHELFGGNYQTVIPQAVAIELFHNFSLIHDDIMDKAPLRRGKKTVHEKWDENAAILSGDAMLVMAYQQIIQCRPEYIQDVLHLFSKTALEVCEGQQLDMEFESRDDVTIDEYIGMIGLKTAVLLGAGLAIGGKLAGASEEDIDHLCSFGKYLGISFQLQDDLLDAFGDEKKFGKKSGGDIAANKKTYLFLSALNKADKKQKAELLNYFSGNEKNSKEKINAVLSIFRDLNIEEITRNKMEFYFNEAIHHLDQINVSIENKLPLTELANSLLIREY